MVRACEFTEDTQNRNKYNRIEISLGTDPGQGRFSPIVVITKKIRGNKNKIDQFINTWFRKYADRNEFGGFVDTETMVDVSKISDWEVHYGWPRVYPDNRAFRVAEIYTWVGSYRIGIKPTEEILKHYQKNKLIQEAIIINKKYSQLEISLSTPSHPRIDGNEEILVSKKTRASGIQIDQFITQWFRKNADVTHMKRGENTFLSPREFKSSILTWTNSSGPEIYTWRGRYRIGIFPTEKVKDYYYRKPRSKIWTNVWPDLTISTPRE